MAEADSLREQLQPVEGPTLPKTQQEVATQAFESAVTPLRESFFKETLPGSIEQLSERGIAFGETGSQALGDVITAQGKRESQIAGQLGAQLGQTALDQAFQSSEATKNRALEEKLQKSGFEFSREEAETGREFSAEQAGLGREFSAEQAGLGREFSSEEAQRARDFSGTQQELKNEFAGEQAALGRTLTVEESARSREFRESLVNIQQEFAADQASIERHRQNQERVLELVRSGELSQDQVQDEISSLLGEGAVLTPRDEVMLRSQAAASGLTVEEFTNIRRAIGTAQGEQILGTTEVAVRDEQNRPLFIDPVTGDQTRRSKRGTSNAGKQSDRDYKAAGEELNLEFVDGYVMFEPVMETRNNIEDYIQNPTQQNELILFLSGLTGQKG